jgi:hypothetical protein
VRTGVFYPLGQNQIGGQRRSGLNKPEALGFYFILTHKLYDFYYSVAVIDSKKFAAVAEQTRGAGYYVFQAAGYLMAGQSLGVCLAGQSAARLFIRGIAYYCVHCSGLASKAVIAQILIKNGNSAFQIVKPNAPGCHIGNGGLYFKAGHMRELVSAP